MWKTPLLAPPLPFSGVDMGVDIPGELSPGESSLELSRSCAPFIHISSGQLSIGYSQDVDHIIFEHVENVSTHSPQTSYPQETLKCCIHAVLQDHR